MNKKLVFMLMASLGMTVLAGCGNTASNSTQEVTQEAVQEAETVKVVHTLGETEVPKNPENVVVFDIGTLDALETLGVEITGVVASNIPEYLAKYEGDEYEKVGELFEPDLEKIYALEPELIIIGARQADYYEQLSEIAPTISMAVDNTSYLDSFKSNMNYLGEIFGKQQEVAEKLSSMDEAIAAVHTKAEEKNVNGLIVLANDSAISVYGQGSRFGIIHDEFGITPVDENIELSNHGQKSSFEYIVEQNPDYIFVVDRAAVAGGQNSAKELIENELIKTTDAYKNNRIIYLDPNAWYVAGGGFISTQIMIDEMTTALEQ
nr:siderophore ABC transporter substrate-binding protein [uncultured Cellulosilyticum sp.]